METKTQTRRERALRYSLGALAMFGALNAFAGGYYGMSGAKDVPREWLQGTPFTSYFVPSAILFVIVGGSLLWAGLMLFSNARGYRPLTLAAGVVLLGWIAVQVILIGYVSWMQPVTALFAVTFLVLAWWLPGGSSARTAATA